MIDEVLESNGLRDTFNWFTQQVEGIPRLRILSGIIDEKRILLGRNLLSYDEVLEGSSRWLLIMKTLMIFLQCAPGEYNTGQFLDGINYFQSLEPPDTYHYYLIPEYYPHLNEEEKLLAAAVLWANASCWNVHGLDVDLFVNGGSRGWKSEKLFMIPQRIANAGFSGTRAHPPLPPYLEGLIHTLSLQAEGLPIYSVVLPFIQVGDVPRDFIPDGDIPISVMGDQVLFTERVAGQKTPGGKTRRRFVYQRGSVSEALRYLIALHLEVSARNFQDGDGRLPHSWLYRPDAMRQLFGNGDFFRLSKRTILLALEKVREAIRPGYGKSIDLESLKQVEKQEDTVVAAIARIEDIEWNPLPEKEAFLKLRRLPAWRECPMSLSTFKDILYEFLTEFVPHHAVDALVYDGKISGRFSAVKTYSPLQEAVFNIVKLWDCYVEELRTKKENARGRIDKFIDRYNADLLKIMEFHIHAEPGTTIKDNPEAYDTVSKFIASALRSRQRREYRKIKLGARP